jgi:hypothetical protein
MFHPVAQGVTNDTGMQRPASQNKPISIFLEEKKKKLTLPSFTKILMGVATLSHTVEGK